MHKLVPFAALLLVACTPFRYFPLPVSSGEARSTFAPIATAASDLGYKFWRWDDSISFQATPYERVSYMFDASNNYVMCVQLKSKDVPGGVEASFAEGKAKGDEVWQRAMALRPAPQPAVIVVPATPGIQINIGR